MRGRKWDPEFMELLPKCVSLDPETGKLTFKDLYASVALNIGWKGGALPIPYSHVVWFLTHGRWPEDGMQLDHVNNDPMDNRPSNLEEATHQNNQKKRRGRVVYRSYGKGKYGYGMGVFADKRDSRFYVTRHLSRGHGNGELRTRRFSLGGYHSLAEAEAAIARHIEEIKIKGLDFVPEHSTKKQKWRTVEIQKRRNSVRRYRVQGKTIAEISKLTGVSESNVYTLVKDMGVDKRLNKQVGYRLTAEQIPGIRQEHAEGVTLVALGKKYGVTPVMIADIVHRRAWKHV
jgi:HNH endonuclease